MEDAAVLLLLLLLVLPVGRPFNSMQYWHALHLQRRQWVRACAEEQNAEHASTFVSPGNAVVHLVAVTVRLLGASDVGEGKMSTPFNGLSNWKLAHVAKSCNGVPAARPAWRPACQGHPQPGTT